MSVAILGVVVAGISDSLNWLARGHRQTLIKDEITKLERDLIHLLGDEDACSANWGEAATSPLLPLTKPDFPKTVDSILGYNESRTLEAKYEAGEVYGLNSVRLTGLRLANLEPAGDPAVTRRARAELVVSVEGTGETAGPARLKDRIVPIQLDLESTFDTSPNKVIGCSALGTSSSIWTKNLDNTIFYNGGNVGVGTAAPSSQLELMSRTGDSVLTLRSDVDNNNEFNNSYIRFIQDGNWVRGYLGFAGDPGTAFEQNITDVLQNSFLMSADHVSSPASIQFATEGAARMTIHDSGNVGIGTTAPSSPLSVRSSTNSMMISLEHPTLPHTANSYATYISGKDSSSDEIWWVGEGSSVEKRVGLMARRPGYELLLGTNSMGRLAIKDTGMVGIGTSGPATHLHVSTRDPGATILTIGSDNSDAGAQSVIELVTRMGANRRLDDPNTRGWQIGAPGSNYSDAVVRDDFRISYWNNTFPPNQFRNDFHIDSVTGNIGMGFSDPSRKLQVNGSVAGVGPYQNLSDERLKENQLPITEAVENLSKIDGIYFDWRRDKFPELRFPEGRDMGVIAQSVEKVFPEAVHTDSKGMKSVSYSRLVAPLIEAVKDLSSALKEKDEQFIKLRSDYESIKAENREIMRRLEALEEKP